MRRTIRIVLLGLAGLSLSLVAGDFAVRRGRTPAIDGPVAVAALEPIKLGASAQWILTRGHDRTKPVLLFLHGGPGMPAMFLAHAFQRDLERDFVVVHWDRRGAGKSFDAAEPLSSLTVRHTLDDAFALTKILRERFKQDQIMLVGHSWGSYLGLLAIREHPEWYSAYVGVGQMAGTREEVLHDRKDFLTQHAALTGDTALLNRLIAGQEPTEDDLFRHGGELHGAKSFWPILSSGLLAREYTIRDALNVKRGADLVSREMKYDVQPKPMEEAIEAVDVPVFFFLGRYDHNTPPSIAAGYLERLRAPMKGLVWFEQSAHFPFFEEPTRFAAEMTRVDHQVRAFRAQRSSS
jgi:pimeloyl-ACP methyl ester carboxylesterase